jgi:hypothetical protein
MCPRVNRWLSRLAAGLPRAVAEQDHHLRGARRDFFRAEMSFASGMPKLRRNTKHAQKNRQQAGRAQWPRARRALAAFGF